ncbi:serine/threonine-protein kinase [Streptomyces botrytidirepellens]|uniref:non-specific serine/threonine protein kinase n=1 Tax=Streptomyces botrytidirepellens TaxID=2486417 RepID=A0A3M8THE2_9ACTN|nr:serine/threonine-protein kinase [Streptomyces botrytidirepellens]RNF92485.1 serine/threonine protein kinase [Streptomyces botrytidirepellens]
MGEIFAGRYELVDPIGRGGVGAVWRVWDHRRRRYVAAKVLQQRDAHTLLRFVREQALRIDHPHVLAPASWAADDDKVLFTMDLVAGGSFAHLIGDYGPLPPRYVCTLLDQLLSGLAAVHEERVVHRDIKPANILLEATGTGRPHVRLGDFGIALTKGEPRLTEANYVMGTPGYFAPEQMMGEEPDFPADLFAVGLVTLYLLRGHKPDGEAIVKLFGEHGVPHAPEGVPEPLWQVIAGLLQPDPDDRFRSATGARKALVSAVEMLPEGDLDDEVIEVFDHLGPLPTGFGPHGPARPGRRHAKADPPEDNGTVPRPSPPATKPTEPAAPAAELAAELAAEPAAAPTAEPDARPSAAEQPAPPSMSDTGSFTLPPPQPRTPHPQTAHPRTPQPRTPPAQISPPPAPPGTPPPHTPPLQHPPTPHPQPPQQPPTPSTAAPLPQPPQPPAHQPQGPQQPGQPGPSPQPAHLHTPAPAPTPVPAAAPLSAPRDYPLTRAYTAQRPRVPTPAARRRGPSRKTTVLILIVAVLCFAVGAWALVAAG